MMERSIAVTMAVLMLVMLFVGGAQPQAVGLIPAPWDKSAHAAFFFAFALLLARFVSLPIALVVVLAVLVGAADEIHQSLLPGRVAGWDDFLADVVGAGLGLVWFRQRKDCRTEEKVAQGLEGQEIIITNVDT